MAEPITTAQRAYRVPCPGCGAPVDFRSAQSTHAVCAYCHSSVVRDGDTLSRIGKMAEVFEDFSLLQLGATGVWQGRAFTLVGRLRYQYPGGGWTEWQLAFDDLTMSGGEAGAATLAEDNGAFVMAQAIRPRQSLPGERTWAIGLRMKLEGMVYTVAARNSVLLLAAQGELSHLPPTGREFLVVELRGPDGSVITVEYGTTPPSVSRGVSVALDALALKGLREEQAREDKQAQAFTCPQCGAALTPSLPGSKSISCASCRALVDLTQGAGAQLSAARQSETVHPLIPLGSRGELQGVAWQVVGFQRRIGRVDEDIFDWREYLLYNQRRGFQFLVDASDGWSLVKPVTGAPTLGPDARDASYLGRRYKLKESYSAKTHYAAGAAGEFYWQVRTGQSSRNLDFADGAHLLSMEESDNERTWSQGHAVDAQWVGKVFGVQPHIRAQPASADVGPGSSKSGSLGTLLSLVVIVLVLFLIERCSECDPRVENCSSSSGSGAGRYSGGGAHK